MRIGDILRFRDGLADRPAASRLALLRLQGVPQPPLERDPRRRSALPLHVRQQHSNEWRNWPQVRLLDTGWAVTWKENQELEQRLVLLARHLKESWRQVCREMAPMTRISRISAPRATVAAVVLLVVAMLGFGLLAAELGDAAALATHDTPASVGGCGKPGNLRGAT